MIDASVNKVTKKSKAKSALKFIFGCVIMIIISASLVLLGRTFVFGLYSIPSSSMEPTLNVGDNVFAWRYPFAGSIEQGDIVTFNDPEKPGRILIKRVIATGGQTVDLKDGKVYIDGKVYSDSHEIGESNELAKSNIVFPYKVPEDSVWLMGDNREHSSDSRMFGAIPTSEIIGKAVRIYAPSSHAGSLD